VLTLTALHQTGHPTALNVENPTPGSNKLEVSALKCPECETPIHDAAGVICTKCGFNFVQWADGMATAAGAQSTNRVTIKPPHDLDPATQAMFHEAEMVMSSPCSECSAQNWELHDVTVTSGPGQSRKPPRLLRFLASPAASRPSSVHVICTKCGHDVHLEATPQI
jgi:hypothetical protein